MSHNWNCPDDWEAKSEARRNAERDHEYRWGKSYSDPYECDHANRAYRDEYDYQFRRAEEQAAEERAAQRRAEERRHEQECEEEYYRQTYNEQEAERQQMEEQLAADAADAAVSRAPSIEHATDEEIPF